LGIDRKVHLPSTLTCFERRDYSWLSVMGRLKPGWTLAQASEHLRAISPGLMQATALSGYSRQSIERYRQFRLEAVSGATGVSRLRETYDRSLWLLLGLTGLVLLIACANLSNLMLARAGAREREFAVRLALGAGRGRLIRQTLIEGLLLAAAGAALGLAIAAALSRSILRFLETEGNRLVLNLALDGRMLAFTAAVACLTCVLLSLAPAPARGAKPAGRSDESGRARAYNGPLPVRVSEAAGGGSSVGFPGAGGGRISVCSELPPASHDGPRLPRARRAASDLRTGQAGSGRSRAAAVA
jgi:hypothetical protein